MDKEEIDYKIVSKDEKFWTEFKEKQEKDLQNLKREQQISEAVIEFSKKKLAEFAQS